MKHIIAATLARRTDKDLRIRSMKDGSVDSTYEKTAEKMVGRRRKRGAGEAPKTVEYMLVHVNSSVICSPLKRLLVQS